MRMLLPAMLLAGVLNATGFLIDENITMAAGAFAGTVALTVAVIAWIDKRIETKLKPLSDQIEDLRASLLGEPKRPPERRNGP